MARDTHAWVTHKTTRDRITCALNMRLMLHDWSLCGSLAPASAGAFKSARAGAPSLFYSCNNGGRTGTCGRCDNANAFIMCSFIDVVVVDASMAFTGHARDDEDDWKALERTPVAMRTRT